MGDYYEVYANFDVCSKASEKDIRVLRSIVAGDGVQLEAMGFPREWAWMFSWGSHYVPRTQVCALFDPEALGAYAEGQGLALSFLGKGDISIRHAEEVAAFFDWLEDVAEGFRGDFLGYVRHDQAQEPNLVFRQTDDLEYRDE